MANMILMCKIGVKFQCASQGVCAYVPVFGKRQGSALIGACALIKTNTVYLEGLQMIWRVKHIII